MNHVIERRTEMKPPTRGPVPRWKLYVGVIAAVVVVAIFFLAEPVARIGAANT